MGRGSVGPEIVGLRREERDDVDVLARGSVGEARELEDADRLNHFVGRVKKPDKPPEPELVPTWPWEEGDAERVKDGTEDEGLTA